MLQLAALILLSLGAILELSGAAFFGMEALIGLCFLAALLLGAANALRGYSLVWGLLTSALAALALSFHVCLLLGLF